MENNKEILIVNITTVDVWGFGKENETIEQTLEKAKQSNLDDIELYKKYIVDYPDNSKYWNNRLKEAQEKKFKAMTFTEYKALEREYYINTAIHEITEDEYNEALNVLPPMSWTTINGVEMFLMSEFITSTYTTQYAKAKGKCYCKTVDAYDSSTWLHNLL